MNTYTAPCITPMKTGVNTKNKQGNYNKKRYKYKVDRSLLPTPAAYYNKQFPTLKIRSEWVKVLCCFHEDKTPSLSLSMTQGHFKCHACGTKGGDIIAFHMQRYKFGFLDAARALGALEVNHE